MNVVDNKGSCRRTAVDAPKEVAAIRKSRSALNTARTGALNGGGSMPLSLVTAIVYLVHK